MFKELAGSKVIRQSCVNYSAYRGTVCPNWTRTDLWGSCRVTGHSTRTLGKSKATLLVPRRYAFASR